MKEKERECTKSKHMKYFLWVRFLAKGTMDAIHFSVDLVILNKSTVVAFMAPGGSTGLLSVTHLIKNYLTIQVSTSLVQCHL